MSLIGSLPSILEESRKEYEAMKEAAGEGRPFFPVEQVNKREKGGAVSPAEQESGREELPPNMLAHGDNLAFIQYLLRERDMEGKLQLVYMDPPFYSKASYDAVIRLKSEEIPDAPAIKPTAYDDSWKTGIEDYLRMLCIRLFFVRDLLAEEGCCWVHLDWHVVHYVKILMDEIFGQKHFVNEIIWNYKSGGTGKRSFSKKHDTLLFYGKTKGYYFHPLQEKSYNRGYKPYCFKGVQEFQDEIGWYTLVNMKDVWQIDMVGRTSSERTGYATQKPEQLLRQIIESCTRPGDVCADFFGGSGTLAAAAEALGRQWISCDMGGIAMASSLRRMIEKNSSFTLLETRPDPTGGGLELETEVKAAAEPAAVLGEQLIEIRLKGYMREWTDISLKDDEQTVVARFQEQDPLQLLAYWSVDFHYDGKCHRPDVSFVKEKDRIETLCVCKGRDIKKISVRAVDVFGGSTLRVISIGE